MKNPSKELNPNFIVQMFVLKKQMGTKPKVNSTKAKDLKFRHGFQVGI